MTLLHRFAIPMDATGRLAAWLTPLGMIAIIGSALGFEHLGGYAPCALCLEQRVPYYWGIPFVVAGALALLVKAPPAFVRAMMAIGFFCLLATAAIGAYHAGVEWGFWPGPTSCTASITGTASDAGSLLQDLAVAKPPSCDAAAGRFLGISFAGWNVIAAFALACVTARAAFGQGKRSS